jgi:hypothetical protein
VKNWHFEAFMASGGGINHKENRWDFEPWAGVQYIVTPDLPPDQFYLNPADHVFYIGAGTDIQLRLFWLNLTKADREFLKALRIGFE